MSNQDNTEKKVGRPKLDKTKDDFIKFRISSDLKKQIQLAADEEDVSASKFITGLIQQSFTDKVDNIAINNISPEFKGHLSIIAQQLEIPLTSLVKLWLKERLNQEYENYDSSLFEVPPF